MIPSSLNFGPGAWLPLPARSSPSTRQIQCDRATAAAESFSESSLSSEQWRDLARHSSRFLWRGLFESRVRDILSASGYSLKELSDEEKESSLEELKSFDPFQIYVVPLVQSPDVNPSVHRWAHGFRLLSSKAILDERGSLIHDSRTYLRVWLDRVLPRPDLSGPDQLLQKVRDATSNCIDARNAELGTDSGCELVMLSARDVWKAWEVISSAELWRPASVFLGSH